jgi:restriction system protein
MSGYYRIMLGRGSKFAKECISGGFIGLDFGIRENLTGRLPDEWRVFNQEFIPKYLQNNPDKSKIAAGLACGMVWTLSKHLSIGDIVLSPDGAGRYHVGEVVGEYQYEAEDILPHRRPMKWFERTIAREDMSEALRNSTGSIGSISTISKYAEEIERLIGRSSQPAIVATDETIEDPSAFAMEKHLEAFLVQNWSQTELGKDYEIFREEDDVVGQQYLTDTGPIDVLAVSKDRKTLIVVELKKGRASDVVVGQILRYMGFVKDELAEPGQTVRGIIIALEEDQRLKRALSAVPNIEFFKYVINFSLRRVVT